MTRLYGAAVHVRAHALNPGPRPKTRSVASLSEFRTLEPWNLWNPLQNLTLISPTTCRFRMSPKTCCWTF
jgi:hypothetical protein